MRGEVNCEDLGLICGGIRGLSYSTRGAIVTAGTVHVSMVAAARVVRTRGTPAAGLRPRPARDKGFPSSLLLD
jgi:hypothetical protein